MRMFFVLKPKSTERICSGIGERVAPEHVQSERITPFWVGGTVPFFSSSTI
jgi:hypothetical protein